MVPLRGERRQCVFLLFFFLSFPYVLHVSPEIKKQEEFIYEEKRNHTKKYELPKEGL